MSILEAASCGAPIMLRDLDLYKNILEGKYLCGKDFEEMDEVIKDISKNPEKLKEFKAKSKEISEYYSEDRLLKIWIDFYKEQAKLKWKNLEYNVELGYNLGIILKKKGKYGRRFKGFK